MQSIDRNALIQTVRTALSNLAYVDAAWEGGSAAFGALDEYSDVDAVLVVADDAVEPTFSAVEAALSSLSPIKVRYDVPGSFGYTQKFYSLRDACEFLVLDLVLIRRSDPLLFRETELHGTGTVWFDRTGVLREAHMDPLADRQLAQARIPQLRAAFAIFQHIPTKERLRGRCVEALQFYQSMTLRPLVEALRLLHCPQRRGFGMRYLARDLPADIVARMTQLFFVHDLKDLEVKHNDAQDWFWATMDALDRDGLGSQER